MSATKIKEFYTKFQGDAAAMQKALPDASKGFMGMFQSIMKEGALSVKQKELIAMALGMALRCAPCIYLHVKKCLDAGATREEILEAASVVVMMQGGPGYVHLPEVLDALEALGQ